jgi:hypothetical protein
MAGADAITSAAGAGSLIAGATPFGWAQLGAGVLSGVAGSSKPGGPSESGGFFGSSQSPFDSSGWTVNFGDNANQDARTGDRGGSSLNPTASGSGAGGYSAAAAPGGSASGGMGISPLYLVGGAVLLLLLWKKR